MQPSRFVTLGLLAALLGLSACVADTQPEHETPRAVPDYVAPAEAPALCEGLAGSSFFLDLPAAMGELTAGGGLEARSRLATAHGELRGLVEELPAGEHPELRVAADRLLAALVAVLDPTLTPQTRSAVLVGMDEFTAQLQPVCEFPV